MSGKIFCKNGLLQDEKLLNCIICTEKRCSPVAEFRPELKKKALIPKRFKHKKQ